MINLTRLFPHRTTDEIQIRLAEVDLVFPGGRVRSAKSRAAISIQPNLIELHPDEELADWSSVRFEVRAVLPESSVSAVLPDGSDLGADCVMIVSTTCDATKLRRRVFLTKSVDRVGEWYGTIDLRKANVRDSVEFKPVLARTRDLPESVANADGDALATYRGAIVGYGDSVVVRIDEPKERRGGLRVRWENFKESDHHWRRTHHTEMFFVDVSEDEPEVVLNGAHELLKQTLMKKRARGAEASIKAALIAYVAHTAWTTLFLAALADCVPIDEGDGADANGRVDFEEVGWPADEFKKKVLRRLLPLVVPDFGEDRDRLAVAVELYRDPTRIGALLTQLNSAAQEIVRVDNFVVKTLEESVGVEETE